MPRQARLDAPGTLHHGILRGIERGRIVADAEDRAGRRRGPGRFFDVKVKSSLRR